EGRQPRDVRGRGRVRLRPGGRALSPGAVRERHGGKGGRVPARLGGAAQMKVTGFRLYPVPPRWLFLAVDTDAGLTGWGEPVIEGRARTVATAVDELAELVVGK